MTIQNERGNADANRTPLHTPGSSSRRLHLTALSSPHLIILIRSNLARSLRWLVNRRRRISSLIRRRRWRERAVLHAVAIRVLRLLLRLLAVVWVLRVLVLVVHGCAVRVIVALATSAAPQHPAVVAEWWEAFACAAAGVPVAADEVCKKEEEEDGDDGVADGGAGLWRRAC